MADVKRWIHDAYAMHMTTRDSRGGDPVSGRLYGMARGVWLGKVMAAVENQPKPYPEILQFLYAPTYTDRQFRVLRRAALEAIFEAEPDMKLQERVYRRLGALAEVALFNYQRIQRGTGPFKLSVVLAMTGIDEANWHKTERHWARRFRLMQDAMHRWEMAAMEQPRAVVNEIEENQRESA